MQEGVVTEVEVLAEKGGKLLLEDPFKDGDFATNKVYTEEDGNLVFDTDPGERFTLKVANH